MVVARDQALRPWRLLCGHADVSALAAEGASRVQAVLYRTDGPRKLHRLSSKGVPVLRIGRQAHVRRHGLRAPEGETNVYFGHAQDPDSLESATAKAAWLDEAGQGKFKLDSWRAVLAGSR